MTRRPIPRWLLLFGLLIPAVPAPAGETLPPKPADYVSDSAHILSLPTISALSVRLANFERQTSNQVLVATFPGVPENYAMEDFTQRTAESWGVGQKQHDNGVVLFVFPKDRKTRIEVGYGLEGALPDLIGQRIIQNEIIPAFKAGDYNAGVIRGVDAIMQTIRGEYQGTGRTVAENRNRPEQPSGVFTAFVIIFLLFFIIIVFLAVYRDKLNSGTYYGPRGRRDVFIPPFDGNRSSRSGGFGGGGFGGGGGFSGGGGSFGGGGASGGW